MKYRLKLSTIIAKDIEESISFYQDSIINTSNPATSDVRRSRFLFVSIRE